MRKIIALSGFKGSGKDTVGDLLKTYHGFQTTSFAKPLKQALCAMFGWEPSMLDGKTQESRAWREQPDVFWSRKFKRQITPRMIMQEFGTEIVRGQMLDQFWIASTQKEIQSHPNKNIAVTDARFVNELDMIKSLGGITVRIKRGDDPDWFDKMETINGNSPLIKQLRLMFNPQLKKIHSSERDWIGYKFDFVIDNDSDIHDLHRQVRQLLN